MQMQAVCCVHLVAPIVRTNFALLAMLHPMKQELVIRYFYVVMWYHY